MFLDLKFIVMPSLYSSFIYFDCFGGGCLNEALNWSVKGFGGLTYSPNLLLEVSTNLNSSFFIYYFDCAISQDSDLT